MTKMKDDGFVQQDNFFTDEDLTQLEHVITKLYLSQALKIFEYRGLALSLQNDTSLSNKDRFVSIYEAMEAKDKDALYQVQKLLVSSPSVKKIFNKKFLLQCAKFLNISDVDLLLLDGPGIFINRPNTQRLLYKFHSEKHFYPKRRNFLNIWFPLFGDKTKDNGTMSLKVKSHTKDFPFTEYSGYNKSTENKSNFYRQYEIPSNLLETYDEHICEVKRGGVILFNSNLVHKSNSNLSKSYSFAGVARIWEHSNDLTLSGDLKATPYGNDLGRADMFVKDIL